MLTLDNLAANIVAGLPPQYRGANVQVDTGEAKETRVRLMLQGRQLYAECFPQGHPMTLVRDEATRAVLAAIKRFVRAAEPAAPNLTPRGLLDMLAAAQLVSVGPDGGIECGAREGWDITDRVGHLHRMLTGAA